MKLVNWNKTYRSHIYHIVWRGLAIDVFLDDGQHVQFLFEWGFAHFTSYNWTNFDPIVFKQVANWTPHLLLKLVCQLLEITINLIDIMLSYTSSCKKSLYVQQAGRPNSNLHISKQYTYMESNYQQATFMHSYPFWDTEWRIILSNGMDRHCPSQPHISVWPCFVEKCLNSCRRNRSPLIK